MRTCVFGLRVCLLSAVSWLWHVFRCPTCPTVCYSHSFCVDVFLLLLLYYYLLLFLSLSGGLFSSLWVASCHECHSEHSDATPCVHQQFRFLLRTVLVSGKDQSYGEEAAWFSVLLVQPGGRLFNCSGVDGQVRVHSCAELCVV
jgi:hypothetical protein